MLFCIFFCILNCSGRCSLMENYFQHPCSFLTLQNLQFYVCAVVSILALNTRFKLATKGLDMNFSMQTLCRALRCRVEYKQRMPVREALRGKAGANQCMLQGAAYCQCARSLQCRCTRACACGEMCCERPCS